MKDADYMCIVHLKDEVYLTDRKAYYLICRLQEVKFDDDDEKMKMYKVTLDWMVSQKRAIKLTNPPTHLIIKFKDD